MISQGHFGRAAKLAGLAIFGQGTAYLLSILLARRLGVDGFEAYAVGSSAFMLMAMVAPRGVEKYTLRLLPVLYERHDWGRARGLVGFGWRRTLRTSLLLAVAVGLWTWLDRGTSGPVRLAVAVSCFSIPMGALVHYAVEVLSANGQEVRATGIFRVAVPSTALVLVISLGALPSQLSGAMAVGCWGVAWALALTLMVREIRRSTPAAARGAESRRDDGVWGAEARPFRIYRISLAMLSQAGVIALDRLHPSSAEVGTYAAAMATANLALVLATSTNRFYSRRLSILLERRDFAGVLQLRRERLTWILPAVAIFLAGVFAFGRGALTLFRPEFAEQGAPVLVLLSVATATTILFSLAPTYLKYMRHNRSTLGIVASAAAAQLLMLVWLVPRFGAVGAATAYAVSMCGMYGIFARMAHRELLQLSSRQG